MQDNFELSSIGVQSDQILAGKYLIDRVIGTGGMGIVVAAHHLLLDQRVALKFLLPEPQPRPETIARFAREARAAARIKSEYVAQVLDVAELDSGVPYMVMEYLEGKDLSSWLSERGPLAVEQAAEFLLQACEGIAEAHAQGIVHRDLKPSNLFCVCRSDGLLAIKILDFGISKITHAGGSGPHPSITKTDVVFGSPLYMSPEQMLSARDVDARTDIWALGAILFELITGHSPFVGETLPEVYARISSQPPAALRSYRPDASIELEAVVLKCLEKDRANRYFNVAELATAILPFAPKRAKASVERICRVVQAAGLTATATSLPSSSDLGVSQKHAGTNAAWGQTTKPTLRPAAKPLTWAATASGITLALCAAAFLLIKGRTNAPNDTAPIDSNAISVRAFSASPSAPRPPEPMGLGSVAEGPRIVQAPKASAQPPIELEPTRAHSELEKPNPEQEATDSAASKPRPSGARAKPKGANKPRSQASDADYLKRQH